MNRIDWAPGAVKQAARLPAHDAKRVFEAVQTLVDFPDCANVKALKGHTYGYRLRVGNYRVLFDFDGRLRVVMIEEVRKRDERTY